MKIRVGFEITYEFVARTPMVLMLNVHPSRNADIIKPDQLRITPPLPVTRYLDAFGNLCTRLVAPAGQMKFPPTRWSRIPACPTWSNRRRANTRSRSCRTTRSCFSWPAGTARPSG